MIPNKQRIEIAKACGWLEIERCGRHSLTPHPEGAQLRGTKDAPSINYEREYVIIPNYPADLNAMHEAEKTLADKKIAYLRILGTQVAASHNTDGYEALWRGTTATAAQRAEAFLRTIGKWEEEPK